MADRASAIAELRARLSIMDRVRVTAGATVVSIGLVSIDQALPGSGLVPGDIHELLPDAACGAAYG